MTIAFTKVALPYGWLGNMSPHPVTYSGMQYKTTEHLFQCLRYMHHPDIVGEIRQQSSPMSAKMCAKKYHHILHSEGYEFLGDLDVMHMILCLKLKLEFHPHLVEELLATNEEEIIEDCTSRMRGSGSFWGAGFVNGEWHGENVLGTLWMEIREALREDKYST